MEKIIKFAGMSFWVLAYFTIVFTMLCGGNLQVLGPLSLRHLCMLFLFGVAFFFRKKYKLGKTALPLYLGYLFIYFLFNLLNGEYLTHTFLQSLYTYHVPCIAIAVGLPAIVKDLHQVKLFIYSLILLYAFDSMLTILQYMNSGFAWIVATMITTQAEEGMERAEMYTNAYGGVMGYSLVAGAFGFVVSNGYFLATYLSVLTYRINVKGFFNTFLALSLLLLAGGVIFIVQQRMAFLSFMLVSFYIFMYGMGRKYRIPVFFLAVIALLYYGISNIEMGRLTTDTNNDTRMQIFSEFFDFMGKGYWLSGGAEAYSKLYDKSQHNTFLAAWVGGGIFTFLVFVLLYFRLLRDNIKVVLQNKKQRFNYPYTICFAIASVIFLFYTITHSAGVHSGSPMFWVVYTMMYISYEFEKKQGNNQLTN